MAQLDETIIDGQADHLADHMKLAAKANYVFDVRDFGAVADGVTDDSAAVQAAQDAATSGGVIYFPPGTYLVSSTVTVDNSGVSLVGDGIAVSKIVADAATFNVITLADSTDDVTFRDLWIAGAASTDGTTQYSIGGSAANVSARVTVENCRLSHGNNGISVMSGTDWQIRGNHFDNLYGIVSGTGYGVLSAGAAARIVVEGNHFTGTATKGRHACYCGVGNTESRFVNNIVEAFVKPAVRVAADSGQAGVEAIVVSGNTIRGGGTSTDTESPAIMVDGVAKDCVIEDNLIVDFDNYGIIVTDGGEGGVCTDNTVRGNTIIRPGFSGVLVLGAKSTTVVGNTVVDASQDTTGLVSGLRVSSSGSFGTEVATDTVFVGNVAYGATQRSGLQVMSNAPAPTGTVISGNTLMAGNVAGRAYELNSVTCTVGWNMSDQASTGLPVEITGARDDGTALANLLTALETAGVFEDSTTAS